MRILIGSLLLVCVVGLSGCNTIKGFGKDVTKTGEAIERSATR